jgi:hypothetical protein
MLRNAKCNPAVVTGFSSQGTERKIRLRPGVPAEYPDTARNGISRSDSFFASSTQDLSCNFTSRIAASGLWALSHFPADA